MTDPTLDSIPGPHGGQPVLAAGAPAAEAALAVILVHGRGAGAESILGLGALLAENGLRRDARFYAPHAAGATWYPQRFLAPEQANQPYLDSARAAIDALADQLIAAGTESRRIVIGGFSQGACLALDAAARRPRGYGAVVALSGGLIGPPGTAFAFSGDLEQTPVFIGCSDVDMHIPVERVQESADVMQSLNGVVDLRIYPGMGHTVNDDEVSAIVEMLNAI